MAMPPSRRRRWSDEQVPAGVRDAYSELVLTLRRLDFDSEPRLIRATPAAISLFAAFMDETQTERMNTADPAIRAMLPKMRDAAARLALVFHCCLAAAEAPGVFADLLDESSMNAGITLARWFINEGRREYAMLALDAGDEGKAWLIRWIEGRGGMTTPSELCRNVRSFKTAAAARAVLDELVERGAGRWQHDRPNPKGGQGQCRFVLNLPNSADTTPRDSVQSVDASASAESGGGDDEVQDRRRGPDRCRRICVCGAHFGSSADEWSAIRACYRPRQASM